MLRPALSILFLACVISNASSAVPALPIQPEATAVITITALPTIGITPIATFFPTFTPPPSIALLTNGSFEQALSAWTATNVSGDQVKCNKPGKIIAYTGLCVYQFKGGAGENSTLTQRIVTRELAAGTTLVLEGQIDAKGLVNAKLKVRVKYTDSTLPKGKMTYQQLILTEGYRSLFDFLTLAGIPAQIKVQLSNQSVSGRVRFDALTLTALLTSNADFRQLP